MTAATGCVRSVFTVPTRELRMDTVLQTGALHCCGTPAWESIGFMLDNSVRQQHWSLRLHVQMDMRRV
jgi:hypothetical protein